MSSTSRRIIITQTEKCARQSDDQDTCKMKEAGKERNVQNRKDKYRENCTESQRERERVRDVTQLNF